MPKYALKDGLNMTTIPGVGAVKAGQVIEGDFDRFVPGKLQRVADGAAAAYVPPPAPVADTEPPPPPEEEEDEDEDEDEGERPSMKWSKDELVDVAGEYGLDSSGTKQDILDRIDEYLDGD